MIQIINSDIVYHLPEMARKSRRHSLHKTEAVAIYQIDNLESVCASFEVIRRYFAVVVFWKGIGERLLQMNEQVFAGWTRHWP